MHPIIKYSRKAQWNYEKQRLSLNSTTCFHPNSFTVRLLGIDSQTFPASISGRERPNDVSKGLAFSIKARGQTR